MGQVNPPITHGGGAGDPELRGLLGPPTNRFTSNAQRDSYTTANPTWLAAYDADDSLYIVVDGVLQHRVASAWADDTTVLRGNQGIQGIQGDPGPPGETFPTGQAVNEVLVASSTTDEQWALITIHNLAAALGMRLVPAPEASNAGQAVFSSGSALEYRSAAAGTGIGEARVEALIEAHRLREGAHHARTVALAFSDLTGVPARVGTFTQAFEDKLAGIAAGAQVNVAPTWAALPDKPTIYLPSDSTPLAESGTGSAGTSIALSRSDHYHPLRSVDYSQIANIPARVGTFTAAFQTKLAGIDAGAEVNVNADWTATSGDALILNKPSAFGGVTVSATAPTSPSTGDLWFDTTATALKVYDGSAFTAVAGSGSGLTQSQVAALITAHAGMANVHHSPPTTFAWSAITGVPANIVNPAQWAGQTDLVNAVRLFSPNQIIDEIDRRVANFAQQGNTDDVPLTKLPLIPLTQLTTNLRGNINSSFISVARSGAELRFGQVDGTHEGIDGADLSRAIEASATAGKLDWVTGVKNKPAAVTAPLPWAATGNTDLVPYTKLPTASQTALGIVELATDAEAQAAATSTRVITPANVGALKAATAPLAIGAAAVLGTTGRFSDAGHVHAERPSGGAHSGTRYLAISTGTTITDAALTTGDTSSSDTDDTLALPTPSGVTDSTRVYLWAAVPADTGDITGLQQLNGGALGLITNLTQEANRTLNGVAYKVYRTTATWPGAIRGDTVTIVQAHA